MNLNITLHSLKFVPRHEFQGIPVAKVVVSNFHIRRRVWVRYLGYRGEDQHVITFLCCDLECNDFSLPLQGIVDSELRDSHNNYVYYRTLNEVDKVLSNFTSLFKVQKRDVYPSPLSSSFFLYPASTAEEKAQRITSVMKGAVGNLIKAHFGAQNTNIFMQRYKQALIEGFTNKTLVEDLANARKHLVLVLCRI